MDTPPKPRYALSFTSGALLSTEAAAVAPVYLRDHDWFATRMQVKEGKLLQSRAASSTIRVLRDLIPRLQLLTETELKIVAEGTSTERGHLMWAAACRRYDLIAEFAEEVLRGRFLTLAGTVSYEEYDSFYRSKAMWHDELTLVTELTYKKLRQVLFRMMVEAELLSTRGQITPILLSPRVAECLNRRAPRDIRFFPTKAA